MPVVGSPQFSQFRHSGVAIGDFGDDSSSHIGQLGAANPVHQGVSDVAPLSSNNNSSAGTLTAWRTHRNAQNAIPQPLSGKTFGSFVNFEPQKAPTAFVK